MLRRNAVPVAERCLGTWLAGIPSPRRKTNEPSFGL
jgi:hypothetical protein